MKAMVFRYTMNSVLHYEVHYGITGEAVFKDAESLMTFLTKKGITDIEFKPMGAI